MTYMSRILIWVDSYLNQHDVCKVFFNNTFLKIFEKEVFNKSSDIEMTWNDILQGGIARIFEKVPFD